MNQSEIIIHKGGGFTAAGPDAVLLYRAVALRSALELVRVGLRGRITPSALLAEAGKVTGKAYRRGAYIQACADLTVWIETMKAALPVREA